MFVQFRRFATALVAPHISAAIRTLVCSSTLAFGDYCSPTLAQSTDPASGTQQVETIHYRSHTYTVPRDYIVGLAKGQDFDKARSFFVEFGLPRFDPRGDPQLHTPSERGWRDQVFALYEFDTRYRKASEIFAEDLKTANLSQDNYTIVASNIKKFVGNFVAASEIYTIDDDDGAIYASCYVHRWIRFPSCSVNLQVWDGIAVHYSFSLNYIYDLKSINDEIRTIIHRID